MTKSWPRLLVCLPLLLYGPRAFAQPAALITDRPDFTESAASVEPGHVQIEAGTTFSDTDPGDESTVGELLARIGLVPGVELRVGVPSWIRAGGLDGFDDGFLGGKGEIPAGAGWEAAVLAGTTVPIGDGDVAADAWQPEVVLAFARDLAEGAGLGLNVGWGRPVEDGDRFDEFRGSAAVGLDLGGGWGAFGETFGFVADEAGPAFVDGGVTRLFGPDFQLDARVGAGLFQAAGEWFIGIGFARRW